MSHPKLGYIIIYVQSVSKTVAFYESAFALSRAFVHESGSYAEMATGSTALAFADEATSASGPVFQENRPALKAAGAEVALVVEDVAAAFTQALEAGASTVIEPAQKPWGQTVAYVRDLNGFLVELCTEIKK